MGHGFDSDCFFFLLWLLPKSLAIPTVCWLYLLYIPMTCRVTSSCNHLNHLYINIFIYRTSIPHDLLGASHIFRCSAQFFVASWYPPTDLIPKEQTLVFRRALAAAVSELMDWIPEIKNPHLTLSVHLKDTSVFADCFFFLRLQNARKMVVGHFLFGHHVVYRPILIKSIQRCWWKSLPFLVLWGESIRTFGRPK